MTTPRQQHILLVDDDEAVRSVLRRGLVRAGYEVREAGDGRAALKLLASAPADLVITDLVMPEMEGIEFILALRKTHPKLPVIAMSGGGRAVGPDNYLKIARACGAMKILAKPFETEQLLTAMQELIGPPPPAGN